MSATGPRYMWQRRSQERALARLWPAYEVNLEIWHEAATRIGVPFSAREDRHFEIGGGEDPLRLWLHVTPLDDERTLRLALDKAQSQRLLAEAGVRVPEQVRFQLDDVEPALGAVTAGGSWVVKPAGTSSGQGATTGVRSRDDLLRASVRASRSGDELLLERRAEGEEYRLLLLDGEPLGAVRRLAPTVRGDGRSTIVELVAAENRRRLDARGEAGLRVITIDLDALLELRHQGRGPGSVPAAGEEVAVKGSRSQGGARDAETVPPAGLSKELIGEARSAAGALGLRLAGIDLITPDVSKPLSSAAGTVIEVNGTPGLHYHYLVRDPASADRVAIPILERMLAERASSRG